MEQEKLTICGGCNAKIPAGKLSDILAELPRREMPDLLVGFDSNDDAAVIKISDNLAIIHTVDFFPAIVSDPYIFGQIAATNALSDVYAMGGDVQSALNIVCFPENLDIKILKSILKGGAEKVYEAGGVVIGGHSIHDSSSKYGLAVNGVVHPNRILKNNTPNQDDVIILTKPLGIGIVTAAKTVNEASEKAYQQAIESMTTLNKYAAAIIKQYPVSSCTDVTGFGLSGHLYEMLDNKWSAELYAEKIPYIQEAYIYAKEFYITAGGQRNRNYIGNQIKFNQHDFALEEIIFDPQTSGGLLFTIAIEYLDEILEQLNTLKIKSSMIGKILAKQNQFSITVV